MSQRDSGYERKERDAYETPAWVTYALVPYIRKPTLIWEPACGSGKMVEALKKCVLPIMGTDIDSGDDFFQTVVGGADAIITNPPYNCAQKFIERALALIAPSRGQVAMLLRADFDHAKTRKHLFGQHPAFSKKIVLTKRIRWFEGTKGSPSFNHVWFVWDFQHSGPPNLAYHY